MKHTGNRQQERKGWESSHVCYYSTLSAPSTWSNTRKGLRPTSTEKVLLYTVLPYYFINLKAEAVQQNLVVTLWEGNSSNIFHAEHFKHQCVEKVIWVSQRMPLFHSGLFLPSQLYPERSRNWLDGNGFPGPKAKDVEFRSSIRKEFLTFSTGNEAQHRLQQECFSVFWRMCRRENPT